MSDEPDDDAAEIDAEAAETREELGNMLAKVLDDAGQGHVIRAVIVYEYDPTPHDDSGPLHLEYRSTGGITDVDFLGLLETARTLLRARVVAQYTDRRDGDDDADE